MGFRFESHLKGRLSVFVSGVGICTMGNQDSTNVHVIILCRIMQRSRAFSCSRIDIGTVREQEFCEGAITVEGCDMEWRNACRCPHVGIGFIF